METTVQNPYAACIEYLYIKTKPNVDKYSSPMRHIWEPKNGPDSPQIPPIRSLKTARARETQHTQLKLIGKTKKRFEGPQTPRILLGKDGPTTHPKSS